MGLKDEETALVADWAVQGWVNYVQAVTRELPATHPVDERMAFALTGEELPLWLENAVRMRLVAARGEALVDRAISMSGTATG